MAVQATAVSSHEVDHAEPNYIAIFIYLAVLTVLELIVAYAPIPKSVMIGGLVGLAWTKAALVAMYFMHLRFERRTLAIVAIVPVLLVTELAFSLVPDLSTRLYAHTKVAQAITRTVSGENPNAAAAP